MARYSPVIVLGDVTDHGGTVLTASSSLRFRLKPVACIGDMVSCPTHGDNKINGVGSDIKVEGRYIAFQGTTTDCGSHLIASQTMFNVSESKKDADGAYRKPLWNRTSPKAQSPYEPDGASPFPGETELSLDPPDGMAAPNKS
ncbi:MULTISPECIES: PAAR domain-containing protein [unclassified Paraburkholderia]|uniref:PAAR domain-containing protein n=1 Tax=unclassified Paraburkholderia TaxID=2615204 RepID=UPI002AAF8C8D|nr:MULTISPECIES: PAAR domain-containing protein [unclassified Paraburkholderia]